MALVVICGQPCSGKSTAAVALAESLKESETKQNVRIIDEDSFHLDRNQNYANMPAEKNLRGMLIDQFQEAARFSEANSLYELDRATQEIINAIVEQQSLGGAISRVTLGNELPPVEICRPVGLPELRRLRRTFVKLMGQSSLSGPPLPTDADSAKRRFADYLNREFGGSNT